MITPALDLNLLRPLQALLEDRSVTRAAERLHVSQPTMSAALARLRAHFGDPLLVRRGHRSELTPLAVRLEAMLPGALGEVERVVRLQSSFDPATSETTFVVAGVDYAIGRIAPMLTRRIEADAPGVRVEFPAADVRLVNDLPDSLRAVDGIILPHGYLSDQPHLDLAADRWVCLVDAGSDLGERPSARELLARRWVHTLAAREGMTPARRQLQFQGIEVSVAVVTPYFHVVPLLVAGTDHVALVPETLARRAVAADEGVRVVEVPFVLEPVRDAFWWHREREHDAEHRWLRELLAGIRDELHRDSR